MPPFISPESRESSSPIITRAVAAGLSQRWAEAYDLPGWQKAALWALGALPQAVGRAVISRQQAFSGISYGQMSGLSLDAVIANRLADYAGLPGRFPTLTVGVGMGGATAHLALALGGPFLPQAFVFSLKGGSGDGNAQTYHERSAGLAVQFARENPGVVTIQHYDPLHDGWLTRHLNHLRLKLIDLPKAYRDFIHERLEPGGEICYLDGGASWLRFRVGERSFFQVGGWGDIPPEEYLEGSERIRRAAKGEGLRIFDWRLEDCPLERGPESEWGSEPGLGEALEAFCHKEGYRFTRIQLPHPNHFSMLAFHAVRRQLEKAGQSPAGVLIEMFTQFDATAVLQSGLLPLWLIFNTLDSLVYLREMSSLFPEEQPVFFSPLATFSITPDLAPFDGWADVLRRFRWANIGARCSHYPADARAVVTWNRELRAWCQAHPNPITTLLNPSELTDLAGAIRAVPGAR